MNQSVKAVQIDTNEEPCFVTNRYMCPICKANWSMQWTCSRNDRCPNCDHEIAPEQSEEVVSKPVRVLVDISEGLVHAVWANAPVEVLLFDEEDHENPRALVESFKSSGPIWAQISPINAKEATADASWINTVFEKTTWLTEDEIIVGQKVTCEIHSDDRVYGLSNVDATPWFQQASEEQLKNLINCDFGGDYPAAEIAQWLAERNTELLNLLQYVTKTHGMGFECHVNAEEAAQWLLANREGLVKTKD